MAASGVETRGVDSHDAGSIPMILFPSRVARLILKTLGIDISAGKDPMFKNRIRVDRVVYVLLLAAAASATDCTAHDRLHVDPSDNGMVVSESAAASRIGREMLLQGGTAVDAAVATAFALAVTWPEAGNIGGGGFMMIRPADGKNPVCIDYRETAPSAMTATSFSKKDTTYSRKAVAVPGTVRGLAAAHARYGRLPWKDLVMPSAKLAARGVPVNTYLAKSLNAILEAIHGQNDSRYGELRRVYGKQDGGRWIAGERLVLPDLSRTLTEIAGRGPDTFYTGRIANLLVQEMNRGTGVISLEDLRQYKPMVRPAMQGTFRGFTILGAPPPSSGGTCVIEALNILENFDLASRDRFHPVNVHLIAEASRRVFADRARYLGDPDFTATHGDLIEKSYAKRLADTIRIDKATSSESIAPEIKLDSESPDTTHFSVIDGDGMAVSNTYTLEASWGSRIVVQGGGFVLNNEMGDFNWFPGQTTRQGRIGTKPNVIEPGKRMLSSQSPTILEKDGKVVLITGSPGGRTIINTVLNVVLNVAEFGMRPSEAVRAERMHHQWFPDRIELEDMEAPPHSGIVDALKQMGHQIVGRVAQGSAHSIAIDPETNLRAGIADYRRGGRPAALATETIALWDFGDPRGLPLSRIGGIGDFRWTGNITDSETDGRDHFRVRGQSSPQHNVASVDFVPTNSGRMVIEVKFGQAVFAGSDRNERLRITLSDSDVPSEPIARLILGRSSQDQIFVGGEAPGGGTNINPSVISEKPSLEKSVLLRLELDAPRKRYRFSIRDAAEVNFTYRGSGVIAHPRTPNRLSLDVLNDLSDEGEYVSIDRIEIRNLSDRE